MEAIRPARYGGRKSPNQMAELRKLGIPTVVDRVIQQAIAQKLQGIWELLFSDSSYGYRPKRSAQQTIRQVKENAEQGYRYAVSVDLLKYFDTLNHELLMNLLHRQILYIGLSDPSLCGCGAKPAACIVTRKTPTEVEGGRIYN